MAFVCFEGGGSTLQENGVKHLRASLCQSLEVSFLQNSVLPLLAKLGDDSMARGVCQTARDEIFLVIYNIDPLMRALRDALIKGAFSDPAPIGWFIHELCLKSVKVHAFCDVCFESFVMIVRLRPPSRHLQHPISFSICLLLLFSFRRVRTR